MTEPTQTTEVEPRHLTQSEQRAMDAAVRQTFKIVPDPELVARDAEIERLRGAIRETCATIARLVDSSSDQITEELVDIFYHPILELEEKANGKR